VGVGTAALGLERYGIPTPGENVVDAGHAIGTIRAAADSGISFFDTAPVYGLSEKILGEALAGYPDCIVATKVSIPEGMDSLSLSDVNKTVSASLDNSRRALRRDVLDIGQIHNATTDILEGGPLMDSLERAREDGKIRCLGASVYGVAPALKAVRCGRIQVVQLAASVLDQRMCGEVFPEAARAGVGVLIRSALLKGALTRRAQWLPESLRPVTEASARVVEGLSTTWDALPTMALRFCLSLEAQTVLVGVRRRTELQEALDAEAAGPLPPSLLAIAHSLAMQDEHLLNPTFWRLEDGDSD
jgi:aryl-alcohol dehydrogenase-like predicted oxidoreductase